MDCREIQAMVSAYIRKELDGKELEIFLDHIRECEECSEELEIYFTIHFALQQLDDETHSTYNVHNMLIEDIHSSRMRVKRRKQFHIVAFFLSILAEAALILAVIAQLQIWGSGSYEASGIYRWIYGFQNRKVSVAEAEYEEYDELLDADDNL